MGLTSTELLPCPATQSLGLMSRQNIVAGVVYNGWTGGSCHMHIAVEGRLTREFLHAMFRYPLVHCGLAAVLAAPSGANHKCIRFARHCGFEEFHRVKGGSDNGEDLVLMELRRENCRFLGEDYARTILKRESATCA